MRGTFWEPLENLVVQFFDGGDGLGAPFLVVGRSTPAALQIVHPIESRQNLWYSVKYYPFREEAPP